jgi:hypothetical protein
MLLDYASVSGAKKFLCFIIYEIPRTSYILFMLDAKFELCNDCAHACEQYVAAATHILDHLLSKKFFLSFHSILCYCMN